MFILYTNERIIGQDNGERFIVFISKKKTVAVAVAFFLCWAPFHAQRIMAVYGKATQTTNDRFHNIYTILTYVSGVLYFLSTCINPLLYSIMSHKFRDAFRVSELFRCYSKTQKKNFFLDIWCEVVVYYTPHNNGRQKRINFIKFFFRSMFFICDKQEKW